ncbi:leucine-rich repeat domain-containing protein [Maribellus sp. YY47]|uniref:leucine-rich repeat domain-containing protein n=1 Tax=Maribellus sp. YY47 TaxID=2929486 RepID=UPI0020008B12|nr:leucine-rich repeat domain-containing protein [Maribellus sp. YY47]MCK3686003.1 leucine-rich repeat domain-containing protein [Maribellus sp. YY47]
MKTIHFIIVVFILISSQLFGQNTNSVVIFNGRGETIKSQKILDLSYQNLTEFPARALNPEIETLILDNNNLTTLPTWIGQLKKLKILSLRNNRFKQLDFGINNCENLEQLYLSGNTELSDISAINSTSKIKLIDVTDTKINALPAGVQMMDNLFYFKYTKKE